MIAMNPQPTASSSASENVDALRASVSNTQSSTQAVADKTVEQAKENYTRMKSAAEETTDAVEDSFATLSKGYKELSRKSVEITRSNVNAHFDFLNSLLGAKSLSEAIELQTSYARRQFETLGSQTKELTTLAQKAATEGSKPLQDIAAKGMSYAKAS